ncbi:iron chelate uptake ABC transporter family permease subunit [Pokkaliibacter sp. CJK22405]|uniref:iron chelate uptake ABC transporter family permease subunit n=1 Tax=Pokkaliibacter sp. CJK22405 TaxID=3384615 RepID=UPI00398507F0
MTSSTFNLQPRFPRGRVLGLLMLLALIGATALMFGAVTLLPSDLWQLSQQGSAKAFTFYELRLPRVLLAVLVGAMLATAGTLVQAVIRNPLASPDILGVSHGASLAAVACMVVFPGLAVSWLPLAALAGGVAAALLLMLLTYSELRPLRLAMTGVALAAFYASATDFLMLVHPLDLNNALLWLTGSLWGRSWPQVWVLLPWALLLIPALLLAKFLNVLVLGEEGAQALGVSVRRIRWWTLGLAVALSAASVAVCGPLSFLALVAPHLARQWVGGRHQWLLPVAMLTGALLLLLADTLSRVIAPPLELPAGIFTALIGAPYFLWLLLKVR